MMFRILTFTLIVSGFVGVGYRYLRHSRTGVKEPSSFRKPMGKYDPDHPCGVVSVSVASKLLGKRLSLTEARSSMYVDDLGNSSAEDLLNALSKLGLSAELFRYNGVPSLSVDTCLIVHLGGNHWAVVANIKGTPILFDPPNEPVEFQPGPTFWSGLGILVGK